MSDASLSDLKRQLDIAGRADSEGVVRAVDLILAEAQRLGASDVHFQPAARALDVRFRIDGVLLPVVSLARSVAPNIVARLKVMAELLTYRTDIPQEGSIRAEGKATDRRVSTFPTVHGENAIVRIFDPSADLLDLDQVGLPPPILAAVEELLRERSGAIFLTGPSGSGKTTTIYACLRRIMAAEIGSHIVTIEDPVERILEGVSQSRARPGAEFDFARGLRSLLRQDPEIIMVGEVRDAETAAVAIEAALTGHLLFTTLHAGSACGVVGRLLDMGIEPYLLTGALRGILNQRLLRRLCDDCKQPAANGWRPGRCERCGGAGYRGRLLVAELLIPDAEFRRAILRKADADELATVAAKTEWKTIHDVADDAVTDGRTTPMEVQRVLGPRARAN